MKLKEGLPPLTQRTGVCDWITALAIILFLAGAMLVAIFIIHMLGGI